MSSVCSIFCSFASLSRFVSSLFTIARKPSILEQSRYRSSSLMKPPMHVPPPMTPVPSYAPNVLGSSSWSDFSCSVNAGLPAGALAALPPPMAASASSSSAFVVVRGASFPPPMPMAASAAAASASCSETTGGGVPESTPDVKSPPEPISACRSKWLSSVIETT